MKPAPINFPCVVRLLSLATVLFLASCGRNPGIEGHSFEAGGAEMLSFDSHPSVYKEDQGRPLYDLHFVRRPGEFYDEKGSYSLEKGGIHFFPRAGENPAAHEHVEKYERDEKAGTLTLDFYDWEEKKQLTDMGTNHH